MLTKTAVLVYHKCHLASSHYLSFRLFAPAGQKSTSLLRGRQGGYRRKAQIFRSAKSVAAGLA